MSDDEMTPLAQAAQAVRDFDRAMSNPSRAEDPVGMLFAALGAASAQHAQERRAARARWRGRPEAKAARSAAARKAAATRAARKAAQLAEWKAEAERDARMPSVACPHIDFVPWGGGETQCSRAPGHVGEDHEDIDGHTWPNDDCDVDDCGAPCGY
ncbi:hypothetical protein PV387_23060 [Streptomyces sp. ME02-6987-2C]|uniref:hypothetical protein n=1 Tax=unclassified Streptomyces TaxID=2593676 RepID=UPI0029B09853|nr:MULTISPECIES: hypothetical protein [unclassified Streptomyces]MDX3345970.1 hypothetical protein [Streptomyces sp. ME02-6979A]MDX3368882.1 hypothetical protein [Streptomyces sp. ME02-6987-2C]MDX3407779.1 hypothetical protein [Streptomyces sp. ME02-6977A]MDX3421736.1 hypothetical protein [Streptomyces sp. ME02-6985-2c]